MQFMSTRSTQTHFQPEDDIDKLFNRLSQLEPSGELISRILSRVRHVSAPFAQPACSTAPESEEPGGPIVHNERREPS